MLFRPRPRGLGSSHFLRLNDKEEVIGIFRGEIYTFKRHWFNNRGQECQGANCQICKSDPENKPSFRFRVNFIVLKNEKWTAKAFEGGSELYDTLSTLDQKFDLSKTLIEITRRGIKQKTKYDVLPLLNQVITAEMKSKIGTVNLLPISSLKNETI